MFFFSQSLPDLFLISPKIPAADLDNFLNRLLRFARSIEVVTECLDVCIVRKQSHAKVFLT